MKKNKLVITVVLSLFLFLSLTGCGDEKDNLKSTINDYYKLVADQKFEAKNLERFFNPNNTSYMERRTYKEIATDEAESLKDYYTKNPKNYTNRKFVSHTIQYITMNENKDLASVIIDIHETQDNGAGKMDVYSKFQQDWDRVNGNWYWSGSKRLQ